MSAASDVSGAVVRWSSIPPKYAWPCPEHPIELKLCSKRMSYDFFVISIDAISPEN
jgi:hypothetical protein